MKLFNFFKKKITERKIVNDVKLYVISYDIILNNHIEEILNSNKIQFQKIEIDKDNELSKKLTSEGIISYPFLDVDGKRIMGINIKEINNTFGLELKEKMSFREKFLGESQI